MLQGKIDIDTSVPLITARTTRRQSITAVKQRTEAGRSLNSEQFLPAVLFLSLGHLDNLYSDLKRTYFRLFHCVL